MALRAGSDQPLKGARISLARVNAAPPGTARGANPQNGRGGRGDALAGILSALGGTPAATVVTDDAGRFMITGVDPGDYRIAAEREGYIRVEYGQTSWNGRGIAVSVGAGQRLRIDFRLSAASIISGRITDPDGEPASQAIVQAYRYEYANGGRTLAQAASARTNDLGEYRLFWLQPGEYFVGAASPETLNTVPVGRVDMSETPQRGQRGGRGIQIIAGEARGALEPILEVLGGGSATIYYPGTLDPETAAPLSLGPASEMRGVDFSLPSVPTVAISGRVIAPFANTPSAQTGQRGGRGQGGGIQVNLTRIGMGRGGLGRAFGLNARVNADGRFEIRGVAPGSYNLTAESRDANGAQYTARTRVDVGSSNVDNVVLTLRGAIDIRGRIAVESTPPQQFKMTQLRVGLIAEDSPLNNIAGAVTEALLAAGVGNAGGRGGRGGRGGAGGQAAAGNVAEDGTFSLENVAAARDYRVRVTGLPSGAYVRAGFINGVDVLNAPFNVVDSSAVLELQIGFSAGRVSGTVLDNSNPYGGALAALVPDDSRRGRSDLYFSATSDANGQFTFNSVPPGNYKLFAWQDIPEGAYQYPDFIRRFEDRGHAVSVSPNGTTTAEVRLIRLQ